jgi:hypothetical protein
LSIGQLVAVRAFIALSAVRVGMEAKIVLVISVLLGMGGKERWWHIATTAKPGSAGGSPAPTSC